MGVAVDTVFSGCGFCLGSVDGRTLPVDMVAQLAQVEINKSPGDFSSREACKHSRSPAFVLLSSGREGGPVHRDGPSTLPLAHKLLDPSSPRTVVPYEWRGYCLQGLEGICSAAKKLSGVEREATRKVLIDGSFRLPP